MRCITSKAFCYLCRLREPNIQIQTMELPGIITLSTCCQPVFKQTKALNGLLGLMQKDILIIYSPRKRSHKMSISFPPLDEDSIAPVQIKIRKNQTVGGETAQSSSRSLLYRGPTTLVLIIGRRRFENTNENDGVSIDCSSANHG